MAESPVVRVAQGSLRGRRIAPRKGRAFLSFQGVPYARPPVGPLRFKIAQPAEPWDGVRDALKEGASCPQVEWIMRLPYRGEEDCLYLNVYTPKLPLTSQDVKLPVMVWIHGGGFEVGSGDTDMYGAEYLVGEDVVVVTFNYRLGILGFLSLDDESVPDNLGLKDQVAALRWVRQNIAAFGGDPNNVTIFGESAGGASVHYHLLSPMSKGLFHRAILQSGTALNWWATTEQHKERAFTLAKELGSSATNAQELLEYLSAVPAKDLIETLIKLNKMSGGHRHAFGPIPEKNVKPGEEVFLPAHPDELMEKRQFHSVPCMVGMTSKEGIIALEISGISKNPVILKFLGQNLSIVIPRDLHPKSSPEETAEKIKKYYFGNDEITEKSVDGFVNMMTDGMFVRGINRTVNILGQGPSPVFYYHFDFDGKLNIYKHFCGASDMSGASHLDELGYLFATPFFQVPDVEPDSREGLARKRMIKLWTNFAKTGQPTPDRNPDPVVGVHWPPFAPENPQYLNISDTLTVEKDLHKERIAFWNKL